jgi:diguanylate cyclase (GGDEF)-like protein/PAS domain S-box-containing protein
MESTGTPFMQAEAWQSLDQAIAMAAFGMDGALLHANTKYAQLFQLHSYDGEDFHHDQICQPKFLGSDAYAQMWRQLRDGREFAGQIQRVSADGSVLSLEGLYVPIADAQGIYHQVLLMASPVTPTSSGTTAANTLPLVADVTHTAILISDAHSRIVYVNAGFERLLGWTLPEVSGRLAVELLAPQKSESIRQQFQAQLRAGASAEREDIVIAKDGQHLWAKVLSNPVADSSGDWCYTVSTLTDITRTKMHEVLQQRVLDAMARDVPLAQVLEMVCEEVERMAPDVSVAIIKVDGDGVLRPLANPSMPAAFKAKIDGVMIGPSVASCGTAAWRNQPVAVHDIASNPLWEDYKDWVLPLGYKACWSSPIVNSAGNVAGTFDFYYQHSSPMVACAHHRQLVAACSHLCALAMEREESRSRIQQLAFYDALTGLPNRRLLSAKAEQVLAFASRSGDKVAVLFVDLDRFKHINDSLGHHGGDTLLCNMATRFKEVLRHSDIAGRLSGDEFVAVLPECDADHVNVVIERMQTLLGQPVLIDGTSVSISASIGVAMFPQDANNIEALLHCADMAMGQAKTAGRGNYSFFSSDMNRIAQERLMMENALREALQHNGLHLHYQPQVEMDTGRLYGVEALARWSHPKLGDIPPVRFIPLAEDSGLIAELGHWVLGEACRQLAQWRAQGLVVPGVSINLSPSNFHNHDLPRFMATTLDRYGLAPSDLTVELTESILLDSHVSTMKIIEQVHVLGVRLSMDDFGTGYSSLSYLRRLPVSELKLDRSFVADLEIDEAARTLSSAILGIGKSLQLTVVAEGIETAQQNALLLEQGYQVAQGYYFARPLAPADFEAWLRMKTQASAPA